MAIRRSRLLQLHSQVLRDSVRIALTIASLNSLEVSACDIGNAYLNASCREKLWTLAGPEFGSEKGAVMIIARALHGLKSSGVALWIKRVIKGGGTPYYKMMLIYVNDVLHLSEDPTEDMNKLNKLYRLKDGTGEPDRYLEGNMERVQSADW